MKSKVELFTLLFYSCLKIPFTRKLDSDSMNIGNCKQSVFGHAGVGHGRRGTCARKNWYHTAYCNTKYVLFFTFYI